MTKKILIKFLNNNCTVEEIEEVVKWVETKALSTESRSMAFQDWSSFEKDETGQVEENFNSMLDKIHHKINIEKSKQNRFAGKTSLLSGITTWLTRAAAILLLPVLGLLIYTLDTNPVEKEENANVTVDFMEVIAPVGSRTVMQLSDGSVVHLNYGSKLKYPQNFSGDTREVELSGEGFFDVAHNPEKPFIVKTGTLNVKALGTAFNVLAYPGSNIETTLVNGKVSLEQTELNGEKKTIGSMIPGQHVKYDIETGGILSKKGNISNYIAWKDGKIVFENESITEVSSRLSRMFNVDIEIADNVKEYTYSVTFVDEPLFQILDLMKLATPIVYKTFPRVKLADGTFSKQKITIEKRK